MIIQTEEDWKGLRAASHAVAITLQEMKAITKVGMTTKAIDEFGGKVLKKFGANSAPYKDYKFPGYACISLNQEACHGIPSDRIIKEGDLINIDVSAELSGYYGDNGCSFIIGKDLQNVQSLVDASEAILMEAISQIKTDVKINEIGGLINMLAKSRGYNVIKNICGHGIGRKLHEEPTEIACWKDRANRQRFKKNSVIAVETFISTGAKFVHEDDDGWTLKTDDGSLVAQHEHTMVVTDDYPVILTWENEIGKEELAKRII